MLKFLLLLVRFINFIFMFHMVFFSFAPSLTGDLFSVRVRRTVYGMFILNINAFNVRILLMC